MNVQSLILSAMIFVGSIMYVNSMPLFEDIEIQNAQSNVDFLSMSSIMDRYVASILDTDIATFVASTVIFGMLLYMRVPMAWFYGVGLLMINRLIYSILNPFLPAQFVLILTTMMSIIVGISIIQYFGRSRVEEN